CTSGPLLDEVRRLLDQRSEASRAYRAFGEEIGAEEIHVWSRGGIAGVEFAEKPDQSVWKKPDKSGFYLPRQNTSEGKAMMKRLKALPYFPSIQEALPKIGLMGNLPVLIDGRRGVGLSCCVYGWPKKGVLFIKVPWEDVDPAEMEEYLREKEAGRRMSCKLDHLMWEPPAEIVEVKEWEVLKEQDEWRAEESGGDQ
ncbi:hypothetical protein, partial [Parasedimentitalea maritima]|uniref:hypothetical protein n=1 Tax=Parasedimentitalea maritima TaxID=2578117 RepID=UPI00131A6D2E